MTISVGENHSGSSRECSSQFSTATGLALRGSAFAVDATGAPLTRQRVLPWGLLAAVDGRLIAVDELAAQLITKTFAARAKDGVYPQLDINHASTSGAGGPAPSCGEITALEVVADDGVYATIAWSPRGLEAVQSGDYKYLSPTVVYDDTWVRVRGVVALALVTTPALNLPISREAVAAFNATITNPVTPTSTPTEANAARGANTNAGSFTMDAKKLAALAAQLGLTSLTEASFAAGGNGLDVLTGHLSALIERAKKGDEALAALAAREKADAERKVTDLVEFGLKTGRITEGQREQIAAFAVSNFAAAEAYVKGLREGHAVPVSATPLTASPTSPAAPNSDGKKGELAAKGSDTWKIREQMGLDPATGNLAAKKAA